MYGCSSKQCIPSWGPVPEEAGVAVQFWGDAPACNATAPMFVDYNGQPSCATGTGVMHEVPGPRCYCCCDVAVHDSSAVSHLMGQLFGGPLVLSLDTSYGCCCLWQRTVMCWGLDPPTSHFWTAVTRPAVASC